MKKLAFLALIISIKCFAQEVTYERFLIVDKKIIWQNVYQKDSINNIPALKKIASLIFNSETTAEVRNQKLNCQNLATYMISTFQFNVLIEEKDNKYRITVSNIVFDSNMQVTIGYVTAAQRFVTLEDAEVRTSDFKFRKNNQSKTNMACLDSYLQNYFKIKPTNNNW
jgi:hypothetical protein